MVPPGAEGREGEGAVAGPPRRRGMGHPPRGRGQRGLARPLPAPATGDGPYPPLLGRSPEAPPARGWSRGGGPSRAGPARANRLPGPPSGRRRPQGPPPPPGRRLPLPPRKLPLPPYRPALSTPLTPKPPFHSRARPVAAPKRLISNAWTSLAPY